MKKIQSPNYTQIPNVILGNKEGKEYIPGILADLDGAKLKVLMVIARFTFGFHRDSVRISFRDIEKMTGLSLRGVQYAVDDLIKKNLVIQHEGNGVAEWEILVENGVEMIATPDDGGVAISSTEKGKSVAISSTPSNKEININKVSRLNTYNKKIGIPVDDVANQFKELMDFFCEKTKLSQPKDYQKNRQLQWEYPIGELLSLCKFDLDLAKSVVKETVAFMDEKMLTIANFNSIMSIARGKIATTERKKYKFIESGHIVWDQAEEVTREEMDQMAERLKILNPKGYGGKNDLA